MKNYSTEDLIYFAGFFDGEGTAAITKISRNKVYCYDPMFSLANSDINVLNWIKEKFGGEIYIHHLKGEITVISISTGKKCKANRDGYTWRLEVKSMIGIIFDLIPYLKVKKSKCLVLLDFLKKRRTDFRGNSGRPSWYINWEEEMRKKMDFISSNNLLDDVVCNTNKVIINNSNLFDYE